MHVRSSTRSTIHRLPLLRLHGHVSPPTERPPTPHIPRRSFQYRPQKVPLRTSIHTQRAAVPSFTFKPAQTLILERKTRSREEALKVNEGVI